NLRYGLRTIERLLAMRLNGNCGRESTALKLAFLCPEKIVYRRQQLSPYFAFANVALPTCGQGCFCELIRGLHTQEQYFGIRSAIANAFSGLNTIHFGHSNIHQDEVWLQFCGFFNRLLTIRRHAHDIEVLTLL